MKKYLRFAFLLALLLGAFTTSSIKAGDCWYAILKSVTETSSGVYTFEMDIIIIDGNDSKALYVEFSINGAPTTPANGCYHAEDFANGGSSFPTTLTVENIMGAAGGTGDIFFISYTANNGQCQGGTCADSDTPLPVELTSFTGTQKDGMVELSWTTESELNNRHFEIQRSEDGITFENIGTIEGQGTSNFINHYKFIDDKSLSFAYYRLKQVDYDGTFDFSQVISVESEAFESKLIAYPTQAFNEITIRFETLNSRKSFLKIASISGQVMHEEIYYSASDIEYLTLNIKDYPTGIYYVSLSNNKETINAKFVVVKD